MNELEAEYDSSEFAWDRRRGVDDALPLGETSAGRAGARLVFLVYFLLIGEGVLRKWVFPSFHKYLIFLRDPVVLYLYFTLWRKTFSRGYPVEMRFGASIALASIAILLSHDYSSLDSLILFIYGWRNYFFLIPLPFIMREILTETDFRQLVRWTLFLTIPVAVIMVFQSWAAPTEAINQGYGLDEGSRFQSLPVGDGFYRPHGPFTSSIGPVMLIGSSAAMALAMWILPPHARWLSASSLIAATLAIITMLGVSGSRAAFVVVLFVFGLTMITSFLWLRNQAAKKAVLLPVFLGVLGALVMMYGFTPQFDALANRVNAQASSQGGFWGAWEIVSRMLDDLALVVGSFNRVPVFGVGLGVGTNAGAMSQISNYVAEGEWGRNILDLGPLLGIGYLLFRWMLLWRICRDAIHATKRTNDPFPVFFAAFVGPILFNGFLTGHNTTSGYGWLFVGFALAAAKSHQQYARERWDDEDDL